MTHLEGQVTSAVACPNRPRIMCQHCLYNFMRYALPHDIALITNFPMLIFTYLIFMDLQLEILHELSLGVCLPCI